ILTSTGGMTSHAAVVARGMGKSCIAGCADVMINGAEKYFEVNGERFVEGDLITLDGGAGLVIKGDVPKLDTGISEEMQTILEWADEIRTLRVRTNADTPADAQKARELGAQGIGLTRTEHMFFDEDRIDVVRKMIMAKDEAARRQYLELLLPFQKADFMGIFEAMSGLPVTVRLLDPPLHEFLPQNDAKLMELANQMEVEYKELKQVVDNLHEVNPMLGHRGCRLGITYPEIYEMQVRAITEAAIEATNAGHKVIVEIEVPLVGNVTEFKFVKEQIESAILGYGSSVNFVYKIGTMIEIPRACLTADEIAEVADFFSFGTNDLTQTTLGLSRDDAGKFIAEYLTKGIIERDPGETIDQNGVGKLMQMAVGLGRQVKHDLDIGICGEHGGEPDSIDFCHRIGLNYVSCSPFRVPIARLAAAHAAIKNRK
nr:pyruvate, phosphate dikinase [Candidatus Gracilibacteria bacterium]